MKYRDIWLHLIELAEQNEKIFGITGNAQRLFFKIHDGKMHRALMWALLNSMPLHLVPEVATQGMRVFCNIYSGMQGRMIWWCMM